MKFAVPESAVFVTMDVTIRLKLIVFLPFLTKMRMLRRPNKQQMTAKRTLSSSAPCTIRRHFGSFGQEWQLDCGALNSSESVSFGS